MSRPGGSLTVSMALGTVEVRSLAFAIEAADTAVKSAPVEIVALSYALPGVVAVTVRGSVDAVAAAVSAVTGRLDAAGAIHGVSLLGRPDAAVDQLLAERSIIIGDRAGAPRVPGRGPMHDQVAAPIAARTAAATTAPSQGAGAGSPAAASPTAASPASKRTASKSTGVRKTNDRQGSPGRDSGSGTDTKGER